MPHNTASKIPGQHCLTVASLHSFGGALAGERAEADSCRPAGRPEQCEVVRLHPGTSNVCPAPCSGLNHFQTNDNVAQHAPCCDAETCVASYGGALAVWAVGNSRKPGDKLLQLCMAACGCDPG